VKKRTRISQFGDLRLIAESTGLSEQKIEALERKARRLQKLREAVFDTDEALPEGVGVVNEYYQGAKEQHNFSQLEVDFPVDIDEDVFNWREDAIRRLMTKKKSRKKRKPSRRSSRKKKSRII